MTLPRKENSLPPLERSPATPTGIQMNLITMQGQRTVQLFFGENPQNGTTSHAMLSAISSVSYMGYSIKIKIELAQLRRCASRVTFRSKKFWPNWPTPVPTLSPNWIFMLMSIFFGHHVGHLVYLHVGHHVQPIFLFCLPPCRPTCLPPCRPIFFVGHLVHLHSDHHVHFLVGHHVGQHNVVPTLCKGSETLTEWKYESMTNVLTDGLTGLGACG